MSGIKKEIIIRSIQKTATLEELKVLNNWLKENEKNISYYYQLEEIWSSKDDSNDEMIHRSWEKLAQQIKTRPEIKKSNSLKSQPKISWLRYVAAIFIGILISSTIWMTYFNNTTEPFNSINQNTVYSYSGVQHIVLPDQSSVWLNENSHIVYPNEFVNDRRLIALEGKAYFDIQSDIKKPFIVKAGEVEVEVVGTEFFVESPLLNETSITLISGKVNLKYENHLGVFSTTSLTPGTQATIDCKNGIVHYEKVNTDYYIAWKDGTYRFSNETLEDIIPILAKHFNFQIDIAPFLKNKRFTGSVISNQDIETVLSLIGNSYPLQYQIYMKEKRIEIYE